MPVEGTCVDSGLAKPVLPVWASATAAPDPLGTATRRQPTAMASSLGPAATTCLNDVHMPRSSQLGDLIPILCGTLADDKSQVGLFPKVAACFHRALFGGLSVLPAPLGHKGNCGPFQLRSAGSRKHPSTARCRESNNVGNIFSCFHHNYHKSDTILLTAYPCYGNFVVLQIQGSTKNAVCCGLNSIHPRECAQEALAKNGER